MALVLSCKDDGPSRASDGEGSLDTPDAAVDAGDAQTMSPSTSEDHCVGGAFVDEMALVGAAPFTMSVDARGAHVLYLTPSCVDSRTDTALGAGIAYFDVGNSDEFPKKASQIYANDGDTCRALHDPTLSVVGEKTHAYFLGDDPAELVTTEVYGIDTAPKSDPTRITEMPGEESSLAAASVGGAPLLAWAASERGKPASIWTQRQDGVAQPYLLLAADKKHSPRRVALTAISETRAALAWSSMGEEKGVFLQVIDRIGEPVGDVVQVSSTSGDVDLAVSAKADNMGYVGAVAYTVDSILRFRRFKKDGELESGFRVISPGNVSVSGLSLASAYGNGFAAGYRSRITQEGVSTEVVQVTLTDSQGTVAAHRVLAEVSTGVGPVRLQQGFDGRFLLAWADRSEKGVRLHVQRALCD